LSQLRTVTVTGIFVIVYSPIDYLGKWEVLW